MVIFYSSKKVVRVYSQGNRRFFPFFFLGLGNLLEGSEKGIERKIKFLLIDVECSTRNQQTPLETRVWCNAGLLGVCSRSVCTTAVEAGCPPLTDGETKAHPAGLNSM